MSIRNEVRLLGHLGKDAKTTEFDDGKAVNNCTLATTEKFKDRNGELKEVTTWHNLRFRITKDLAERLLVKGNKIAVSGMIKNESWQTVEGEERSMTIISVREFELC